MSLFPPLAPHFDLLGGDFPSRPSRTTPVGTEGNRSSGTSPTLHLLGVGKVGQAFLSLLPAARLRLVAATDSSASCHDERGLPVERILAEKRAGAGLATARGAESLPLELVVGLSRAALVVDALPSDVRSGRDALRRCLAVLGAGKRLVLASKDALAYGADALLDAGAGRVGCHAALGGTGLALVRELAELRRGCTEIALVGNASTTALITALERGCSLAEGVAHCQELGLLEPDPTLDLDGTDAATKLAIVARAVLGLDADPLTIPREDARRLDPELLRARRARGSTTRLVARATREGALRVRYEEVAVGSPLRVPADRVVYCYRREGAAARVHVGHGVGAAATARALLEDVLVLAGSCEGGAPCAR